MVLSNGLEHQIKAVCNAIDRLFSVTSVSQDTTREALEEIMAYAQTCVDSLEDDARPPGSWRERLRLE